jgi:hypothetical protein
MGCASKTKREKELYAMGRGEYKNIYINENEHSRIKGAVKRL